MHIFPPTYPCPCQGCFCHPCSCHVRRRLEEVRRQIAVLETERRMLEGQLHPWRPVQPWGPVQPFTPTPPVYPIQVDDVLRVVK